jgi:hypothetical protein
MQMIRLANENTLDHLKHMAGRGMPNGEILIARAQRAIDASKFLLKLVTESNLQKRSDLLIANYASRRNRSSTWANNDFSVDGEAASGCEITLTAQSRALWPLPVLASERFSTHQLVINYSETEGDYNALSRRIWAVDREPAIRGLAGYLGSTVIANELHVSDVVTRTPDEALMELDVMAMSATQGIAELPSGEDFMQHVADKYGKSLPSEEDLHFIYGTLTPRVQAILDTLQ